MFVKNQLKKFIFEYYFYSSNVKILNNIHDLNNIKCIIYIIYWYIIWQNQICVFVNIINMYF